MRPGLESALGCMVRCRHLYSNSCNSIDFQSEETDVTSINNKVEEKMKVYNYYEPTEVGMVVPHVS